MFNILAAANGIVKYIRSHSLIIFVDYSYLYAQGNFSQKYFNDIIISEFILNWAILNEWLRTRG